jgi:hypothetical protein
MAAKKPVGWRKEPVRHGLAAKGVKTRKWRPYLSEQILHRHLDEIAGEQSERSRALRLANEARSNLIVGGEVGVLVNTAVDHLREGDYEGAYAAFASARKEAVGGSDVAEALRGYEIRAKNLSGRKR